MSQLTPDVCANLQLLSAGAEPMTKEEYKAFMKTVENLRKTNTRRLKFKKLYMPTTRSLFYTPAMFGKRIKPGPHLRFIIAVIDTREMYHIPLQLGSTPPTHQHFNGCRDSRPRHVIVPCVCSPGPGGRPP